MDNKESHIDDLFRQTFGGDRVTPPGAVWDKVEKDLDGINVEQLYGKTFKDDRETVPAGIWFKIQQKLWVKDFLGFTPARMNIYYTAAVSIIAGLGLYFSSNHDEPRAASLSIQSETLRHQPQATSTKTASTGTNTSSQAPASIETSASMVKESSLSTQATSGEATSTDTPDTQRTTPIPTAPASKVFTITGDTTVCVQSGHVYTIRGDLATATAKWVTSPGATVEVLSSNSASITWGQATAGIVSVEITQGEEDYHARTKVNVIEAVKPVILGDTRVCEGTQKQYRIDKAADINKMYTWGILHNAYSLLSNGFISVEWKNPGYDTIKATDMHLSTGCIITTVLPIVVYSKPEADFTATSDGGGAVIFTNTSSCGKKAIDCKQTCTWTIDYQSISSSVARHVFEEAGSYPVVLEVRNEFGCKSVLKRDVQVNTFNIFVPTAFSPSTNDIFVPSGENMMAYKMEIFNPAGKKVWESDLLSDGKPAEGWDGSTNGKPQPQGTYTWKISATFKDGTTWRGVYQNGQYANYGTFYLLRK